nr:hypothetical protein [uncultured Desulfobacter sp.]
MGETETITDFSTNIAGQGEEHRHSIKIKTPEHGIFVPGFFVLIGEFSFKH